MPPAEAIVLRFHLAHLVQKSGAAQSTCLVRHPAFDISWFGFTDLFKLYYERRDWVVIESYHTKVLVGRRGSCNRLVIASIIATINIIATLNSATIINVRLVHDTVC